MATLSDADLVHAARAGEVSALGLLLERHQACLYATALHILRSPTSAQDAVQDTLIIAMRRLGHLREPAAAGGWLAAIVRSVCLMQLRTRRELPVSEVADRLGVHTVEGALDGVALRDWVWTALARLPDDLQATVMLRYFTARCSYAEIAAVLGVPVGSVRSRLNQAKRRLADAVLRTAGAAHQDHQACVNERRAWWTAAAERVTRPADATLYTEGFLPDALVEAPSLGYREHGVEDHRRDGERSGAVGVHLHLIDLVAGNSITIIDGTFDNPADDPDHCPPTVTEVRIHPGGRTGRLILHHEPDQTSPAHETA